MKKLAGLVVILAVLVLGGYFVMGVITEKTIKKNVRAVNQSHELNAEIVQYDRGWFTSEANIKWNLHLPERIVKDASGNSKVIPAQDYQMNSPIKIYHGPFIFMNKNLHFGMGAAHTVFPFPEQYNQQFDAVFAPESTKPYLDLNIFVTYTNRTAFHFAIPAFKLIAKDGSGSFDWMGLHGSTSVSAKMEKMKGKASLTGLTLVKDDMKLTTGEVNTNYKLHQTANGLYLGNADFSLPSLEVFTKEDKTFDMKDLSFQFASDIEDKLFYTTLKLDVKSLLIGGQHYGPGKLEISLNHLDADVLAELNAQAVSVQNKTEAERQQAMLAMLPQLPKLFAKGAELEVSKLYLQLPSGTLEGNLLFSLPKEVSGNPFELFQKIKGHAKLKIPAALVKELMKQSLLQQMAKQPTLQDNLREQLGVSASPTPTPQEQLAEMQADKQMKSLAETGLVVVKDADLTIELNLEQGKLTVNEKPFSPAMLKF